MSEVKYKWFRVEEDFELPSLVAEGGVTTVEVEGKKLAIAKVEGEYFAVTDRCPHAGASIGEGWTSGHHQVVCPLHRIKFNLKTGRCTTGEGYNIRTYPTKMEDGTLFVGFEESKWWGW